MLVGCLREANVANFNARGLVGVDKHLFQMVSLVTSMTQIKTESNFLFYYSPMSMLFRNKNNKILSKTRRKISSMSSITKLNDSTWCACFITRCQEEEGDVQLKIYLSLVLLYFDFWTILVHGSFDDSSYFVHVNINIFI